MIAGLKARYAVSRSHDGPRALAAGHIGQRVVVRGAALALVDVHEVDPGRRYPHQQLARTRLGIRPLADGQDLGTAVLLDHDCAHALILAYLRGSAGAGLRPAGARGRGRPT